MSHFNTVHGYIHAPSEEEDFNRQTLASFPFDKTWPFPNIFCLPEHRGRPAMICFAMAWHGSAYAGTEDWEGWLNRFENLLSTLRVNEAQVEWSEEMQGTLSVYYRCEASWDQEGYQPVGHNRWVRLTTGPAGSQSAKGIEEQKVL